MRLRTRAIPVAVLAALLLPISGEAANAAPPAQTAWVDGPEGRVRLVAGGAVAGTNAAQRWLGLTFDLKPGWKIFWRSPGAPGLPPVLDWSGSVNLRAGAIIWPAPIVFDSFWFRARGYGGRVTLPIRATPKDPAKPVLARLRVRYQVCKDVCIPGEARLALTATGAGPGHPAIARALTRAPKAAGPEFSVWQASLKSRRLVVSLRHRTLPLERLAILIEAPKAVRVGRTSTPRRAANGAITVELPILGTKALPAQFRVRITVVARSGAWERSVTVSRRID